jgi:hypothetical protein
LPPQAGQVAKYDDEYERQPRAQWVRVTLDNLNTPQPAAL